jgi:hypothetical protein
LTDAGMADFFRSRLLAPPEFPVTCFDLDQAKFAADGWNRT